MNFAFEWAVQHLVVDIQQHRCCLKFCDFMISLYQSVVSLGGSAASLSGAFGGRKSNDGPSAEWTSSDPWRCTGDLLIFVRRLYTHITCCNIYVLFAVISTKFKCPTIQGSERPPMLAWMSWQSFVGSKSVWFYDRKLLITGGVMAQKCRLVRARNDATTGNSTFKHANRMRWQLFFEYMYSLQVTLVSASWKERMICTEPQTVFKQANIWQSLAVFPSQSYLGGNRRHE